MYRLMFFVSYLTVVLSCKSWALDPIDGRALGLFIDDEKLNPLSMVFDLKTHTEKTDQKDNFRKMITEGDNLEISCSKYSPLKFSTFYQKAQFERTVLTNLQYKGIDLSIKYLGAYAKSNDLDKNSFDMLSRNLVSQYCSKNITFLSQKNIESNLQRAFKESLAPDEKLDFELFISSNLKDAASSSGTKERRFTYLIKMFRSFCSWSGESEDLRLLGPYVKDRYIMSDLIQFLKRPNEKLIYCQDNICRKGNYLNFKNSLPKSIGSTGLSGDLNSYYCHHLKEREMYPKSESKKINEWVKSQTLEEPFIETNLYLSLLANVPDVMTSVESFTDLKSVLVSSTNERWQKWAESSLKNFSTEIYFEEPMSIYVVPRRNLIDLRQNGFGINLNFVVGEIDKILSQTSLSSVFSLKISKNYIRQIRTKWTYFESEIDQAGKEAYHKEISNYLMHQLLIKDKIFKQSMLNPEVSELLAKELIEQAINYKGPMFNELKDEIINIPVRVTYGLFALQYLAYKLDVQKDRFQ